MKIQAKTDATNDVECASCSDVPPTLSQRDKSEASVPEPEVNSLEAFSRRLAAEKKRRTDAGSVEAICAALGIPEWHLYKVVLSEAQSRVLETHGAERGPRREMLGDIVAEALAYATHCTRSDEFKPIWTSRSYDALKRHCVANAPAN